MFFAFAIGEYLETPCKIKTFVLYYIHLSKFIGSLCEPTERLMNMKNIYAPLRRRGAVTALILALCCLGGAVACSSDKEPADTVPAVTMPAVTQPDLTDDRTPTSVENMASRLDTAFSTTEAAPASDFTYTVSDGGVTVTGYSGGEVVVVIPDTIDGQPVVAIAEKAFADKGNLQALSIPDTVETIGIGALEGCESLSTLRTPIITCHTAPYFGALFGAATHETNGSYVPNNLATLIVTAEAVTDIPDYAFYACRSLEAVFLPDSVESIGAFAFYGCEGLTYIPLGHTAVASVGERAFTNCRALLALELPTTVERMGLAMLEGCGKLESLTLPFAGGYRADYIPTDNESLAIADGEMTDPKKTTYLGYLFGATSYTFTAGYLPASLIRVTLLPGCGDIPANAFYECASLREVVIPDGVTTIGYRAFYRCERLATVSLPDSVRAIGDDAYHGCIRLVDLDVGEGLILLGVQTFMECLSLKEVTLPISVSHLPNATFAGCISLESLTAPGVATCGSQVFRACDKLVGWDEVVTTAD